MKSIAVFGIALCFGWSASAIEPLPRKSSDFTTTLPAGKELSLSSYRGKVVLVQFLSTTCPHCQATARVYTKLANELGPQGLQVVGVAFNPEVQGKPGVVDNFVITYGVGFPVGMSPVENVLGYLGISMAERYVVPQIAVIDRKGMIRAQSEPLGTPELQTEAHMRSLLEALLKETATTKSNKTKAASAAKSTPQ